MTDSAIESSETPVSQLVRLPTEMKIKIFSFLDGESLIATSATGRHLRTLIHDSDEIWKSICVLILVPSLPPDVSLSPAPYKTYRNLYLSLRPFAWFTPAIWHGNRDLLGSLYVSRYNHVTGHLEAHEVFCVHDRTTMLPYREWSLSPAVFVQDFRPRIDRSLTPVIKFGPRTEYGKNNEIPQPRSPRGMTTTFFHAAPILPERIVYPQMSLWPPLLIPADDRTRNESPTGFRGHVLHRKDASTNLFRLRRWISFMNADSQGVIMGERVETIARLRPELWTRRDPQFPYRGVWIGDYESHGGEFVLFHQPTKNRLEAIKLTGDPNVPRAEYSFVVDDLSHTERVCSEPEWPGARVVAAQGHTAALNFTNNAFSPTQLILISADLVAHYWINLSRIKIFRRVDIDDLMRGGPGL
ncbi:hypothetical protein POJ06DRAFT_62678 [Lipomyces tetrasporus]|uniref:F-box domain-containing protein n=1 Tax=Lipomyces tetrasporus TaxID=54092 RepID=A0AAD7VUF4_9ASCO|nr:uncharacterized protein POJ06DRAFT_62678 [Lipomyces tetrasporus]KAJ8103087.1 hypothetical protein POJ06DRAFT_62678 [Lipomyces tetrasporus]